MANNKVRWNQGMIESVATPGQFLQGPFYLNLPDTDVAVASWTAVPTLQNSWANASGFQAAQYKVTPEGRVWLRGTIDTGTKAATTLLFTLPTGARPPAKTVLSLTSHVAAGVAITLIVDTDGTVKIGPIAATTAAALSFEGQSFDINT